MSRIARSTLITLTCLAAPASAFADTDFTDSTFNLATYSAAYTFKGDAADTVSVAQCATCGNPGQALDITMTEPDGGGTNTATSIQIGIINSAFSYNPATQGAIGSISASIDKDITDNAVGTLGNSFRPLIEQDGKFYAAVLAGPTLAAPGTTGYATIAGTGLTAADFLQVDPTTGVFGTANPDFDGDTMLFGLLQNLGATTVPGTVIDFDYDNLNIDLAGVTVPEPGSLPLLLSGLAALVGLGWSRRRA
jgi:hypothetical protein